MSEVRNVIIDITKATSTSISNGFGILLIVVKGIEAKDYKTYNSSVEVAADYPSETYPQVAAAADIWFAQTPQPTSIAIATITATDAAGVQTALQGLANKNSFYYLYLSGFDEITTSGAEDWIKTQRKLLFEDTTSQVQDVKADRVVFLYHTEEGIAQSVGWVSAVSSYYPGSATWKYKHINGLNPVEFDDPGASVAALTNADINTYITEYGVDQTTDGLCSSGEYIDIIQGEDVIVGNLESNLNAVFVSKPKVPYTDDGIKEVAAVIDSTLKDAENESIISDYTITVPTRASISDSDVSKRLLNNVSFTATLVGAVHTVSINGVVKY